MSSTSSPNEAIGTFKLLTLLLVLNVAFQLISDATAGKIILLFGTGVSVTVLYFPFVYIISDVVTEVYGYERARTVLWYTMAASIVAGSMYQLAVAVPPAPFFEHDDAYRTVFGIVPRVLLGGWIAVFCGDIVNNYALAKMKLLTGGRWLWTRTIGSTVVGQLVNTAIFYVIALSGVLPTSALIKAILLGWFIKTLVEVAMTPLTYYVVRKVKSIECIDTFDRSANFNPFVIKSK